MRSGATPNRSHPAVCSATPLADTRANTPSPFLFAELCFANTSWLLAVNKPTGTDPPSCPAVKTPDADICARARVSRLANHHRRTTGMQTDARWKTRRLCLFSHSRGWKYAFARPKIRTRTYKHVITTCTSGEHPIFCLRRSCLTTSQTDLLEGTQRQCDLVQFAGHATHAAEESRGVPVKYLLSLSNQRLSMSQRKKSHFPLKRGLAFKSLLL